MVKQSVPHLQIVHIPGGIEDPYTQQPWERTPREPRVGEEVMVHVVTRPRGAAGAVFVHLSVKGGEPGTVPATLTPWEGEGDRWSASLGAFPGGTCVSYNVEAHSTTGERFIEGHYSFDVGMWHPLKAVTAWQATGTGVLMHMGDTGGAEALVSLEMLDAGELQFRVWLHAPSTLPGMERGVPCTARREGDDLILEGGDMAVRIHLVDGSLALQWSGEQLMCPLQGQPLFAWLGADPTTPRAIRLSVALTEGEALYGTGERFDTFNRRGQRFDVRVYEPYKNQGTRTYLPVPLVLSSRGYALCVEGTRPLLIDAGVSAPDALVVEADVDRTAVSPFVARLFLAETPLKALQSYLRQVGLPTMPPEWVFGLWMSSNDWNSQARVLAEVERGEQEGIAGDVVVIEAWSDETTFYIWNDAHYALLPGDRPPRLADFHFPPDGRWPDPLGMIERLHKRGLRLLLWQIPLLKHIEQEPHAQNSADVETVISYGWCARNPDGSPYRNPGWWFTGALLPDFTSPGARAWWLARRRYLVEEMGVDGFKTDGGEHLWGRDIVFADRRRGDEMVNAFPVLYQEAYHQLLHQCGRADGLTFSRAGYAGSQRYPAHWAGDENSTWEAFRHSIVAGLSAGASGIPFWGWDIAGFSGEIPSGELYRRAWMMATFCPIMQYHSEYNANRTPSRDRTPWNIAERTGDAKVLPVCRFYTAVRRRLRPYILREAEHTARTGRPLMCALPLAYAADPRVHAYPYQYLFGRDLLVAPTVNEGATTQEVYLPAGMWHDLWTLTPIEGPRVFTVQVPPDRIPVYTRAGAGAPFETPWGEMTTNA